MNPTTVRTRTAFAMLLACLLAPAAFAAQDAAPEDSEKTAPARQDEARDDSSSETGDDNAQAAPEAKPEDERICRYVRLDMSSRRKTKVCRTVEQWRELNNIR